MFVPRLLGLLLLLGSAEWVAGQELQRVYMLNAGYSAHYHIFTRVDEILYYQLYRACDSIQDPVDVPVPPLLSEIAMERLSNNTWDFEDLASKLGGLKGNLSGDLGWLLGHGPEAAERLQRLRAELALRRKSNQTRLPAFKSTLSAARRQQKRAIGETNATSRNPATAFTSLVGVRPAGLPMHADEADGELQEAFHLPVDDLGGCAMERLEPVGKAQWMRPFTVDGYIDDSFLHTVLNTIKNESIDHYLLDIFHRPDEPYTFERTSENGLWSFVNSEQIADSQAETKHAYQTGSLYVPPNKPVSKDDNFRVVVGSGQNHSNHYAYYSSHKPTTIVPMIASTYFQHTSSACELSFRHRVHGVAGAELVVTTQHLEHRALLREDEENEDDAADWVRPTLRAQFKPISDGDEQWTKSRVSIGQTLYPTRIRIECHAAPTQRDPATQNVECNVDDITFINCDEELWKADTCSGKQAKKYLCHKYGPQKCIDYADVCDMTAECEGGEDEDNSMQKCMNVPEGARCDFEFPSETGCPQWKFFVPKAQSSSNSSVQYLQRTSHENKRLPSHGIPPRSYAYHGQNKSAGHFLFFSTYGQSPDQQPSGEVLYTYATTPSFPPTPSSVAMHESPNYRACMLMLEAGADWSHKEVLWTPPHAEGSDPCVWQKAAASIPHQDGEYRLKLAFGKLYKQPVSVAIDDFTMTPNCFHECSQRTAAPHFAPDRLDVKSKTLGKRRTALLASYDDDRKLWFVPHTGAYRVELCSDGRPMSAVRDFVGGSCPRGRFWNVAGGQGAAARAAGPEAAEAPASSAAPPATSEMRAADGRPSSPRTPVFASAAGVHSGDGRVLFLRCAKECPENATCEFEPPVVGQPAVEFCLCPNGKHAREYTVCGPPEGAWLIAFILFLVYRPSNRITRWLQENVKCCRTEKDVFGDMIEMNCIKKKGFFSRTSNGNRITSNPIYERLSVGDLPQIPRNSVQLMKSIGCGAFGEVYDAILCTGEVTHRVAVKTLPLDATPGAERDFQIEARMLHQLVHTNIIKFYGVAFEDLPNYIVLEYMEGGDMRNFLRDHRPRPVTPIDQRHPLMLYDLLRMALDVANGCWYMERTKFVHRDLAARNCLLSSKGPDRVAKLADFGLSRDIFRCNDHYQKNGRALMALKWMPPESFLDGMFNNKTDVWSYGVLLWEIFTMGYAPYQHRTNQEVMEMVAAGARLDVPVGTPQELYNIMLRCWSTNPEYRPTFEELVSIFSQLVADPQLAALPTPPAAYQMYLAQNTPSSTSSNTRSSHPLPDDQMTQATMSTNMSESFNSAILMPTSTDGVQLGVCEAYTGRPNPQFRDLKATGDSSQSSHDSTLHQSVDESVRAAAAYQLDDEHGGPWQPPVVARRRPNLNLELTRPLLAELPPEDSPPPPLPPKYNGYSVSNSPSSSLSTTPGTPPPTMPRTKKSPAVEAPPPPVEPGDYANDREREHQDSPVFNAPDG
ncbi:Tyrosine-protein kinase receptor [Aphelenchoides fujianensis]|nr:Tyrosine-protein kinase receptor [Aphelenchoides fujianensis]